MIVEARDVHKTYHQLEKPIHALRGISIQVKEKDFIAIVGPSGCGKSTFLHLIGALDTPTKGDVLWRNQSLASWNEASKTRLRLEKIGFVFQRFYLLPMLTAKENIELPLREMRLSTEQRKQRVNEMLDYVGLSSRENHRPSQLSGGEMQRVAIARALANKPEILLADEPTGELDVATGKEIASLFERLNQDGLTIILVTHNQELSASAQKILHMKDGRWE